MAGLALRIVGTGAPRPELVLIAASLQAAAFLLFAGWVWRALDPRPLRFLRWHLTTSTVWLGGGCAHTDTWDPKRLGDPQKKVAGTKMGFPGFSDPGEQADVIAYLATLK